MNLNKSFQGLFNYNFPRWFFVISIYMVVYWYRSHTEQKIMFRKKNWVFYWNRFSVPRELQKPHSWNVIFERKIMQIFCHDVIYWTSMKKKTLNNSFVEVSVQKDANFDFSRNITETPFFSVFITLFFTSFSQFSIPKKLLTIANNNVETNYFRFSKL